MASAMYKEKTMKHRNLGRISEQEKMDRTPSQQPAKYKRLKKDGPVTVNHGPKVKK